MLKLSSQLPKDRGGNRLQVMTPPAISPVVTIAAAGDVDVSKYNAIEFSADIEIYWGSDSSNVWPYKVGKSLGIAEGVTTIHVSAACQMLVM